MSTTLVLPKVVEADAPAAVDWLSGLDARPRRAGARRLAALLLAAAILVVAVAAVVMVWLANEPALSATLVAPANDGGAALYKARLEPRRHRVVLTPVGGFDAAAPTHSRQAWLMRVYGPPAPLGLLNPRRTTTLAFDRALLPPDNPPTHLFVTQEAPGGSQRNFPQGPTIAEAILGQDPGD